MKRTLVVLILAVVFSCQTYAADIRDRTTLEAFVDGVMRTSMEEHNVAGAVVVVTTPDETLLAKGWGYSDVDNQAPVSPDRTLFRIASVSKLFVWVAIMQLVEEGKIDLDADINEYLGSVQVPDTYDEPVTMKHLMTHTPGFEDLVIGLFRLEPESMRPLADILTEEMPKRVRPPGTYASYSNHGVGMAGLIIEEVTGQSWTDYVTERILKPLGMNNTAVLQPLPENLSPQMSKGYRWQGGKFQEQSFEFVPLGPAGGMSAAGDDMAIFLRQFLNLGEVNGSWILSRETSRQMQSVLFRAPGTNNGMLHGLIEGTTNGERMFGHGGDTLWFHSSFIVMPDADIGFFVSTNSDNGGEVRSDLRRALLNRYFPAPPEPVTEFEPIDRNRIVGDYAMLRHSHTDLTKIARMFAPLTVTTGENDELILISPIGDGDPIYLQEVTTGVFQEPGTRTRMIFDLTNDGPASHFYLDSLPIMAFERASGLSAPWFSQLVLAAVSIVSAWILIIWTAQRFVSARWHAPPIERFRTSAYILAIVNVAFLVGLSLAAAEQTNVVFGLATSVKLVMGIGYLAVLMTVLVLIRSPAVLLSDETVAVEKLGYGVVVVTALAGVWFLFYWRLLFG